MRRSYVTARLYVAAAERSGGKQHQQTNRETSGIAVDWESCHCSCSSASVAMSNAAVSFNSGNSFSLWAECSRHHFICQTASIKHLLAVNPQRHKPPEASVETLFQIVLFPLIFQPVVLLNAHYETLWA